MKRMLGNITLPVMIRTRFERENEVVTYIPEIFGHWNPYIEREMNWHIYEVIRRLAAEQYEEQGTDTFAEMISAYEIKTNERNILSLTFTNYAYADGFAHGLTLMNSITFDVLTGKRYDLASLFKPDAQYIKRLTELVNKQVQVRDIPVFDQPITVASQQSYYLADQTLVLYYPLYEVTPYYYGIPHFPIPLYQLARLIDEEGPLGRLLTT